MAHYRTAPAPSTTMPPGIPYIVVNEAAERFSYYGMRTILYVFMTKHLLAASGQFDLLSPAAATEAVHIFISAVYFLPVAGALLCDTLLGKYRTILWLSLAYCLGHLALALDDTRRGLWIGLSLIAIGAGGIKPCVAAHVGDQFGKLNQHLLERVYNWFYFSINLGGAASTVMTPMLLQWYGPHVAFGVPGVLMLLATIVFWMGRNKFVHVPPGGWDFLRESFTGEGRRAVLRLLGLVCFVTMFWSVYDQTSSTWIEQATHMDRQLFGYHCNPSAVQVLNPLMILLFVPLFAYVVYPAINRLWTLTPLRKIGLGFFVTVAASAVTWWIQILIDAGQTPSILWQALAYMILGGAEIMVSVTCLEFFYTQSPKRMKSVVMSIDLLAVSLGNLFTAMVNGFISASQGASGLEGANYFRFFTLMMLAISVAFVIFASFYRGKTYLQDEAPAEG